MHMILTDINTFYWFLVDFAYDPYHLLNFIGENYVFDKTGPPLLLPLPFLPPGILIVR